MKAAIVLESWKFSIFKRHLLNAGYVITTYPEDQDKTMVLSIEYTDRDKLQKIVEAAQAEAKAKAIDISKDKRYS